MSLAQNWLSSGVWLVSARIATDDTVADGELRQAGFRPIETLITLQREIFPDARLPSGVRPAGAGDWSGCLDIARTAFSYDRFHADVRVPKAAADRLKAVWVENSLKGRADAVLVVLDRGQVAGFVTCLVNGDAAVIDLIAVAPGCQGRGLGRNLVQGALAFYAGRKALMRVGTQAANTHSLGLYEGQGFKPISRQATYHWVNEGATA